MKLRYPQTIGFPITTRCSLQCEYCSRKDLLVSKTIKPNQDMPLKLLDRIIASSGHTKTINISSGFGEPLLYPKFIPLLKKLKKNKKEILLFSNGNVVNKPKIKEIVRSVKRIMISLDYGDKNKYEKIRKNASFEKVILFLSLLNFYKKKYNSKIEIIITKVFLEGDSLEDLRKIIQFAHDSKVSKLEVRDCYPFSSVFNFNKMVSRKDIKHLRKQANLLKVSLIVPRIKKLRFCSEVKNNIYLTIGGGLQFCCFDPLTEIEGDIYGNTCAELFNSKTLKALRKKFNQQKIPKNCLICPIFNTR